MFIEAKDDGSGGDNWSYKSCKAPVKIITTNKPTSCFFTGRMPFLLPNQQCQSTEGKISHSMDLLTPSSSRGLPTLSVTTNSSWLPWRRVAMPLISPLMPVPPNRTMTLKIIYVSKIVIVDIQVRLSFQSTMKDCSRSRAFM